MEAVVLLLIREPRQTQVAKACTLSKFNKGLGISKADLPIVLAEARSMILSAAKRDRKAQAGMSISRLNDLYSRCLREGDLPTALAVQKDMNRLDDLYNADPATDDDVAGDADELRDQTKAALAYLLPLKLADADRPLSEHARLAVGRVVELESQLSQRQVAHKEKSSGSS